MNLHTRIHGLLPQQTANLAAMPEHKDPPRLPRARVAAMGKNSAEYSAKEFGFIESKARQMPSKYLASHVQWKKDLVTGTHRIYGPAGIDD